MIKDNVSDPSIELENHQYALYNLLQIYTNLYYYYIKNTWGSGLYTRCCTDVIMFNNVETWRVSMDTFFMNIDFAKLVVLYGAKIEIMLNIIAL